MFNPTHSAPVGGMGSWEEPDPSKPSARLAQGTPVEVLEWRGAWARILCSNGWGAWVDGRKLVEGVSAPGAPAKAGASIQSMVTRGVAISLGGAAVVAISTLLPWFSFAGATRSAYRLPVEFLFAPRTTSEAGTLGIVVLLVAILGGLAVFLPQVAKSRRIAGLVLLAIPVLYMISIARAISPTGRGPFSVIGLGPYLCLFGAAALLAGEAAPIAVAGNRPREAPAPGAPEPRIEEPSPPASQPYQPEPISPGWGATHRAPQGGLRTWPAADPSAVEGPRIGGGLDVRLLERHGDWAHVECSNGWRTWVDGRQLESR